MFRRRKFVFDDDAKQAFLVHIEEHGLVGKAARHIGTTSRIIKAAVKDDEEFSEAFDESMALYLESLEEEIHRRGVEGVEEEIYFKGEVVGSKQVYSDQLLVFETKANIEKYGDKSKQEVHITGGVLVAAAPAVSPQAWIEAQEAQNQLPAPAGATEETDERVIDVRPTEPIPV
jgi:hypothetical protein